MVKSLKPLIYRYSHKVLRAYWYIRRPKTQGVRVLILSGDTILLIKHTYGSALWTVPGGDVKANEDLGQAARREVQEEEVGLQLASVTKLGEVQHNKEYKRDTVHVFLGHTQQTDCSIDQAEIAEARWFPVNGLPRDLSSLFRKFLVLAKPLLDGY